MTEQGCHASQDIADTQTNSAVCSTRCDLCHYIGGSNAVFNSIPKYVSENIDKVHIDEMCRQIAATIQTEVKINISVATIKNHITQHVLDRKVMNCLILKDLRSLMRTTGRLCVVRDPETNAEVIDHKTTSTYLDVIKQITLASKAQ